MDLTVPDSWKGQFKGLQEFNFEKAFVLKAEAFTQYISKGYGFEEAVEEPDAKWVLPKDGSTVQFEKRTEVVVYERPVKPCCSELALEPEGGRIVDL
jgi:hypothetical protein